VPGAEVTVEANPDDATADLLQDLLGAGVNRLSMGMQSAVPRTLALLQRTHRHEEVAAVADLVRSSGIPHFSVDLIYGVPGESPQQWESSVRAALALQPDHISAYCLGIEEGTRLGAAVRSGLMADVDPDEAADRYEVCDALLDGAGYRWYEISNWAREGAQCRHNLGYWRGAAWWGAGPGAHSHVGGVRWWNVRHPRHWAAALVQGASPAAGREILDDEQRHSERVMLGIRLAEGLPVADIGPAVPLVQGWLADGLAELVPDGPRFRLTVAGRLVADRLALDALAAHERAGVRLAGDAAN